MVTNNATGDFRVNVYDTGKDIIDPDETVELIEINQGDAEFKLAGNNGVVDLGLYKYRLIKGVKSNGKSTWYLATKADHIPYPDIDPDGEIQDKPEIDKDDKYVQEIDAETGKDVINDTSAPELRDVLSGSALAGLSMASVNRQILRSENVSGRHAVISRMVCQIKNTVYGQITVMTMQNSVTAKAAHSEIT